MDAKQFMYFEQMLGAIASKLCSHDEQFVKIDKRFIEMDQKIDKMQSTMNMRMDRMDQRMDQMDQRMDKMDQRMDQMDQRMDRMDQKMDKFQLTMNTFQLTMEDGFARLSNPERDVPDIKLDVYETKQRLSIVEANAIVLNQKMDSEKAKRKRMETQLEKAGAQ